MQESLQKLIEGEIKFIVGALKKQNKLTDQELSALHKQGVPLFFNQTDEKLSDRLMELLALKRRSKNLKNELMIIIDELFRRGLLSKAQHEDVYDRYLR